VNNTCEPTPVIVLSARKGLGFKNGRTWSQRKLFPFFFTPFSNIVLILTAFTSDQTYETKTTLSNGYLGSRNDEERSEMRYVMRIAELSESSNL
jgi:hypothetical protein